MSKLGAENVGMFDMSPLTSKQTGSMSFNETHNETHNTVKASASGGSAMSTDSVSRAPFGELQANAFEFKPVIQPAKQSKVPFGSITNEEESQADNAVTPQRKTAPISPGTVYSKLREDEPRTPEATRPATLGVWSDLLLWTEPLQSMVVFVSGLMVFGLMTWVAYGAHRWSLMSAVANLLLLDLGVNFVRYFMSEPWHKQCLWTGSKQLNDIRQAANSFLIRLGSAHDKYLSAEDPTITIKVAGALWALTWLGSYVSLWWFALLSYIAAFTVPAVYAITKDQITGVATAIRSNTIDQVDRAGLPRTVRWGVSAAILVGLVWFANFSTALIGSFVICTYWRTLMFTREIAAVRNFAELYTHSVHKVSTRIGVAAEDAFQRLSTTGPAKRTKSHFRAE